MWAKKIHGKMHYFGSWGDPDGSLKKSLAEQDALHSGRKQRESVEGYAVKTLCNDFPNAKQALIDSGELTRRSWQNYKEMCEIVIEKVGKARLAADLDPDDFAALRTAVVAKGWGVVTLGNCVQRVRVLFRFAFDNGPPTGPSGTGRASRCRPGRPCISTARRRGQRCSAPQRCARQRRDRIRCGRLQDRARRAGDAGNAARDQLRVRERGLRAPHARTWTSTPG
ncbi:hypothetical protein [Gemmata massiliana]|uniref:hypothetical protein n=1 Tax=Gemmata massiliana TaxID=1210884 RepID=UPI0013A6EF45|nr:hypothetical protein [Gemmata massiliana]